MTIVLIGSPKSFFFDLQLTAFSLCPHMGFPLDTPGVSSSHKDTSHIGIETTFMTYLILINSLIIISPNIIMLIIITSTDKFHENTM